MDAAASIRGTPRFAHAALACLALFACGFLLYQSLGVFLGTFRSDEIFFLHLSWSEFHGYSHECSWYPALFAAWLKSFWTPIRGDVSAVWGWRVVLFGLAAVQAAAVCQLAGHAVPRGGRGRRLIQAVSASAFLVAMGSFRGFELRPEVLPNTALLLAALLLFRLAGVNNLSRADWVLTVGAGIGLVLGASISNRHVLPGLAFFIVLAGRANRERQAHPLFFWGFLLACAAVAGYLNLVFYDGFEMIRNASAYQAGREPFPRILRYGIGGGHLHLAAKSGLLLLLLWEWVGWARAGRFRDLPGRLAPVAASGLGLLGFYAFLFTVDVRPYEYVRSIEWILLTVAWAGTLRALQVRSRKRAAVQRGLVAILVAVVCLGAVRDLQRQRPTGATLKDLWRSASGPLLASKSDSELVQRMFNRSVLDQVRARGEYCARHPDGLAIVQELANHPVGMKDGGSSILGGWALVPTDVGSLDFGRFQYVSLPEERFPLLDKWKDQFMAIGDVWIKK